MLDTLLDIASTPQFLWTAILVAMVAVPVVAMRAGRWTLTSAIIVTLAAILLAGRASVWLVVAAGVAGLSGLARSHVRPVWLALPAIGSALSFSAGLPYRFDFLVLAVSSACLATWTITSFQHRHPTITWALLWMTAIGVFFTVPEADNALALALGMAIPALYALLRQAPSLTPGPIGSFMVLFVWVAIEGGMARTGSIVGALAGLAILIIEPLALVLSRSLPILTPASPSRVGSLVVILAHGLVVALTSRLAGFAQTPAPALVISGVAFLVGWMAISREIVDKSVPEPARTQPSQR